MKKLPALLILLSCTFSIAQQNGAIIKFPDNHSGHFLFNIQADTLYGNWLRIAPIQRQLFGVTSYYWGNNRVFICGGADSSDVPVPYCYYYNINTNSYESRDTLPEGRYLGKLVRVKDSLYLVGSVGSNFNIPDGKLYKYNPAADKWITKSPVPAPLVQEMAVCVWKDSLIIGIGGSTNGFGGATNTVKVYDPATDIWRVLTNIVPVNISASQAECIDNTIIVMGGYSSVIYNKIFKGNISDNDIESLALEEDTLYTPFGTGVYRVGSSQFGKYMLFGPALGSDTCINQIWGFNTVDNTWIRFVPNSLDIAAIRSLALKETPDSVYLYVFGGITWDSSVHFISKSERFAFGNPLIGIAQNGNIVPVSFRLYQNYPNPFNPVTAIRYDVIKAGQVTIKVYDITGREVEVLINEIKTPGSYNVWFNASSLSSGIYFYTMQTEDYFESKKMVLLK
jgi:hypothetical protein